MRVSRLILLAGTALCAPGGIAGAQAPSPNTLPTGGAVLAGQASIATPAPNRMQITQGSDRAVIGWQSFSIGGNAAVDIRQPGPGSISVQQVQGTDPSRIFGALSSNGRVVVANPAGVWFGPEARVDAAGIAAAAGRMSPGAIGQFMADGQVRLDQGAASGAAVVNEGRISVSQGGLAALVGPTARNAGTIEARLGRVQIAGGEAATVDFDGDGLIAVRAAAGALAENTGRITADGGRVRMTVAEAKGVLAGAVNMGGVVEARSVTSDAGGITLGGVHAEAPTVTVTGRVDATGQRGGTVTLVGDTVSVRSGARVDASGANGGGAIRVGGDARGAAGTRTARTTRVDQGASLAADATAAGPGGMVVVWADDTAGFAGSITARGAGAGAGGFAEVSGRGGFSYTGTADLTAASGQWGTLLLDPTVINLVAAGGTNVIPGPGTPGTVNLNVGAVVAALGAANVTLDATNTVNVNAAVTWATGGTLRLVAGNNVAVNQPVTSNGAGGFEAVAGNNATLGAAIQMAGTGSTTVTANRDITLSNTITATGPGGVTLRADADGNGTGAALVRGNISLTSGALAISGASVSIGQTVTRNLSVTTGTGAITLAATVGNVDVGTTAASNSNTTVASNGGGTITITAANDVLVRGTTATAGTGTWSQVRSQAGSVSVDAGGDVILRSRSGVGVTGDSFGRIIAGTGMTISAGQDVIVGTGSGASTNPANSASNFLQTLGGTQTITAGRNVIVQAGGQNAEARIRAAGDQTITAGGRLDVFGNGSAALVTAGGRQEIGATGTVTLRGSTTGAFGAEIANDGGAQTVAAGTRLVLDARTGLARIVNSGGNQEVTAPSLRVSAAGGLAAITGTGGTQTVRATGGTLRIEALGDADATITNAGGAQALSATTTLDLLAGPGTGNATITNGAGGQTVSAIGDMTLAGGGGHAAILAAGGPQTVSSGAALRLAGAAGGVPLGLSEATPTGAPTAGSASIQSNPGTAPGVAAGAANQTVTAAGLVFDGPPGTAVIGLQDWRAITDAPGALPRFQSVLAAGTELSLIGSTTVVALVPPPGPPVLPPPGGPVVPPLAVVDAGAGAFRLITEGTPPQPAAATLAAGTGGFTPAGLTEGEGFQPAAVVVEGEDPAAVFANTVLATRVEGLLPPPVPYFTGYVPPPVAAVR
ncbi:MAG: filamentous hemagglutinin N-terminal domain-containing protein [Acetobacteraceae bacterium]|nr:filamentous hemagglutinin N-terminal domain-containing protein [Acetobacteraceae bacterium]